MNYEFSIVIPVYNEEKIVAQSLSHIYQLVKDESVLLVVVDNGSADSTLEKIKSWQQQHPQSSLKILHQKNRGAIYARKTGLIFAKEISPTVVSLDIDCTPDDDFVKDIIDFSEDQKADVLFGKIRQDAETRLLKQVFLPKLMRFIAASEKLENKLFGPLFFGGFFAIKSDFIDEDIFSLKIPIKTEPSIFWSRHSFYIGLNFIDSQTVVRCSSRRFWHEQPNPSLNHRSVAIRQELPDSTQKINFLKLQNRNQDQLILEYNHSFSLRILMLLLDAFFFEKDYPDNEQVKQVVGRVCSFFEIPQDKLKPLTTVSLSSAKQKITKQYHQIVLGKLKDIESS